MSSVPVTTPETVNIILDGKEVAVPKGLNVIEAARHAGTEIPHYCYHQNLSIAGNCRMCQVHIEGFPKGGMEIACNAIVKEGMKISTQETSKQVKDAQAATLEFILINHPLDCTVCDQAGHCKLQDYHFDYNAKPSRFLEEKEHKVKAEPLGPTVMLDGERCIMCTRCIRFCDEVTQTSELGMLNRGDKSVIAVNQGKVLDNPLSGTVVDLCPVGALTHKEWRFNTRIWFTKQTDSICPGCSTGCNVKAAVRDGEVVQVKARMNQAVNKEWLCDEGRYGFNRFLPEQRLTAPFVDGKEATMAAAFERAKALTKGVTMVFLSPDLLLEEYWLLSNFLVRFVHNRQVVLGYRGRSLTETEKILISPDYAANYRGAEFAGLVPADGNHEESYVNALRKLEQGEFSNILIVGDRGIWEDDQTEAITGALRKAQCSVGIFADAAADITSAVSVALPGRSVLEKSGLLMNRQKRLQYSSQIVDFPIGSEPDWRIIDNFAGACGAKIINVMSDRDLTLQYLKTEGRLAGLGIKEIKNGGVVL